MYIYRYIQHILIDLAYNVDIYEYIHHILKHLAYNSHSHIENDFQDQRQSDEDYKDEP